MTNCKNYYDMIFPYLDGELAKSDRDGLEAYMAQSEEFAEEFERRKKTIELIKASSFRPKKSIVKPVLRKIEAERRRRSIIRYSSTAAACVVGAVLIGVFAFINPMKEKISYDAAPSEARAEATVESGASENDEEYDAEYYDEAAENAEPPMLSFFAAGGDDNGGEDLPEAENALPESEETASEEGFTIKSAQTSPEASDSSAAVDFYTDIYAPDYAGTVRAVIQSSDPPDFECETIKDGDNFTVYIREYDEQLAEGYSGVITAPIEESRIYLLYVMIK